MKFTAAGCWKHPSIRQERMAGPVALSAGHQKERSWIPQTP